MSSTKDEVTSEFDVLNPFRLNQDHLHLNEDYARNENKYHTKVSKLSESLADRDNIEKTLVEANAS